MFLGSTNCGVIVQRAGEPSAPFRPGLPRGHARTGDKQRTTPALPPCRNNEGLGFHYETSCEASVALHAKIFCPAPG